jgi:hypothetical protein
VRTVAFILGCPGVGKTSLVRHLLGWPNVTTIGRWTVGATFCALGPYVGATFDGADQLPKTRAVITHAFELLEREVPAHLVALLDGVRLGKADAEELRGRAHRVGIVLTAPVPVLQRRRTARGSKPMPVPWLEEQHERALRLAFGLDAMHTVDSSKHPATVIAEVRRALWR